MPVWTNPPVPDAPSVELVSWGVFEVQLGADAEVTRHVVGETGYGGEGQVSSPITEFDPAASSFRTRSGRVYRVIPGSAKGLGMQGDYVWSAWKAMWPSHFEPRDVTEEVAQAIAEAHGEATYKALRLRRLAQQKAARADVTKGRERSD